MAIIIYVAFMMVPVPGVGALTNVGYTRMCRPIGSTFSSLNSGTGYPSRPWTLGLGIIFAQKLLKSIVNIVFLSTLNVSEVDFQQSQPRRKFWECPSPRSQWHSSGFKTFRNNWKLKDDYAMRNIHMPVLLKWTLGCIPLLFVYLSFEDHEADPSLSCRR